jgi:hypothetical protein
MRRAALRRALDPAAAGAAGPAPIRPLVFNANRDLVSDVWVAGRHLLNDGAFTRLDWPAIEARVSAWTTRPTTRSLSE